MTKPNNAYALSVVTGAAGGVGLATARLLGRHSTLLITDLLPEKVELTVSLLRDEGYTVSGLAADLSDPAAVARLTDAARGIAPLRSLVNAAGLSPVLAGWRAIFTANIIGTEHLLQGFEALLVPGSVAVMVASVAGHLGPRDAEIEGLLADPLQPNLIDALEPRLSAVLARVPGTLEGHAYSFSKRAVIRTCEVRAKAWGAKSSRIVSISPGGIWTAMGRAESAGGKRVNAMIEATPAGRWGTAIEMATAIEFLTSQAASYITGADLRIDGGAAAVMRDAAL